MTVATFKTKFRKLSAEQKTEVYKNLDRAAETGRDPKGRELNSKEKEVTLKLRSWALLNLMIGIN